MFLLFIYFALLDVSTYKTTFKAELSPFLFLQKEGPNQNKQARKKISKQVRKSKSQRILYTHQIIKIEIGY